MSTVFLSYKREDETRVGKLVQALQKAGYEIWWDRGLSSAENWRTQIQTALQAAQCVIVVWTHASVGPAGDFVRDEASQAKRRGVLVPVKLDDVDAPLGFGEIQVIDLTHWQGNSRDPFFQDLCTAVTAKLQGRTVPPAQGPMRRLARRLAWSSLSAMGVGLFSLAFNLFSVQDPLCNLAWLQPQLSDACGSLGIGKRPTQVERIVWEQREIQSCEALRNHVSRFPDGAYRELAADRLAARRVVQTENWIPSSRPLTLYESQGETPARNEIEARAAALERAQASAERLCKTFVATSLFRFKSAYPQALRWECHSLSGGVTCAFHGEAVCELEERHIQETEVCAG